MRARNPVALAMIESAHTNPIVSAKEIKAESSFVPSLRA